MSDIWKKDTTADQLDQLESDVNAADKADDQRFGDFADSLANRPAAAADGVDLSPITKVDATFDGQEFLTIARDCFYHVRQARTTRNPNLDDAILSPQLEKELDDVIAGDVAAHRHHLLPGLEIQTITITSAAVTDGKMTLTVRLHLVGEEAERDDAGKLTSGSEQAHQWDEDWTFWRDSSVESATTDKQRTEMRQSQGGWFIAHKGWMVTAIQRAGADAAAG
jgi:predicted lipid-binding transport protein (Tim44 family)